MTRRKNKTFARRKTSIGWVLGEISEYLFGTIYETTWNEAEKRIRKISVTNLNLLYLVDEQITVPKHHETRYNN